MAIIEQNDTWFSACEDRLDGELQMTKYDDGSVYVELENPFDGDTETGIGRSCSIRISRETAAALGEWLSRTV